MNTTTSKSITSTRRTTTTPPEVVGNHEDVFIGALDQLIAKGFRLWMLLAMIFAILLIMMIIVCCLVKIRIPRTKREIELTAAHRRKRRPSRPVDLRNYEPPERGCKVIVMTTGPSTERMNLLSPPPPAPDAETISCSTCAAGSDHSRNPTPFNGSSCSLNHAPFQQEQHLLTVRQWNGNDDVEIIEASKYTSV